MRSWRAASVFVVSFASMLLMDSVAAQEPGADLRFIAKARFVALCVDGGGGCSAFEANATGANVTQEERQALADVRKRLEAWHRYELTDRPAYAEIVIAVRVGKRGVVEGTTTIGRRPGGAPAGRSVATGVSSSTDDMISVYKGAASGRSGSLLWRWQRSRDLPGGWEPMFERLKSEVEAASKRP